MALPGIGKWVEAVIDVQRDQLLALRRRCHVQQYGRVEPAAETNDDTTGVCLQNAAN